MTSKIKILIGILVIGIILVGGWWILNEVFHMQKSTHNMDQTQCLTCCGPPPCCSYCGLDRVYIRTDKNTYNSTEDVLVSIIKGPYAPSYYYSIDPCCNFDADIKLEKYKDGKWIETTKEREHMACHIGPCIGCTELKETTFKVNFKFESSVKYRFKLLLATKCNNSVLEGSIIEIYSNEFTIK